MFAIMRAIATRGIPSGMRLRVMRRNPCGRPPDVDEEAVSARSAFFGQASDGGGQVEFRRPSAPIEWNLPA
jgi:hypothetical protein